MAWKKSKFEEKRKFPRVKDKLIVLCELPKEGRVEKIEGDSEDLSASGIRIRIPKEAVRDDILELNINFFSDAIPVSAKGKVIWHKYEKQNRKEIKEENKEKHVVGLEFRGLGDFEKFRLLRYIANKLRKKKK